VRTAAAALTTGGPGSIAVLPLAAARRRVRARSTEARRTAERSLRAASGTTSATRALTAAPWPVAVELTAAAARLTNSEVWNLPVGGLTFRTRQRRTDQAAVHRSFVFTLLFFTLLFFTLPLFTLLLSTLLLARTLVRCGPGRLGLLFRYGGLDGHIFGKRRFVRRLLLFGIRHVGRHRRSGRILLSARRGNARLLVFVIRVTRRAARLLHLIVNHRHDRVVGDAALTRTIVVQNVTEPKPALLHELPRSRSFSGGIV
jgi:hypothetical protein